MIKKGLGRGFDSLIPTDVLDETFDPTAASDEKVSELRYISVKDIQPNPHQPRREFEESALEELAVSLREHGVIQPIVVTAAGGGYQIVAGERRWRAAILAGLDKLPALVRTLSDQHKLELALLENLQRKDLNPLEIATAYLKLGTQFNLTHEEIAHRSGGKALSTISNSIRLLKLPVDAKQALVEKKITEGHARQILALDGSLDLQSQLLQLIIRDGWSVRKAEQFVIGYKRGDKNGLEANAAAAARHTKTETAFTRSLAGKLRLKVMQKTTAKGGQIIISYRSDADLDRIKKLIVQ